MARVRLTQLGYADFTGNIGKVAFADGVSDIITEVQADAVGSVISADLVGDDGATVVRQAGGAARAVANKTTRAGAFPNRIASADQPRTDLETRYIRSLSAATYTLTDADAGYLLDFTAGCVVTVPVDLDSAFYCSLRQGGDAQIQVAAGQGATVVEIDNNFKTEKKLAVIGIERFPDGSFQISGRTAA
jgi:hypothetical protein